MSLYPIFKHKYENKKGLRISKAEYMEDDKHYSTPWIAEYKNIVPCSPQTLFNKITGHENCMGFILYNSENEMLYLGAYETSPLYEKLLSDDHIQEMGYNNKTNSIQLVSMANNIISPVKQVSASLVKKLCLMEDGRIEHLVEHWCQ